MSYVILPSQVLKECLSKGYILSDIPIAEDALQPASLDLRLGAKAWRVAASFLPGQNQSNAGHSGSADVADKIETLKMHEIDLTQGAIFEKGCVYIVVLEEGLALPRDIKGRANPKSSTGRLDVFARVMTDQSTSFDNIPQGYHGKIYVEIAPRTFSIRVKRGDRLVQLRLSKEVETESKIDDAIKIPSKLPFTVDVEGSCTGNKPDSGDFPPIIGWRARKHAGLIDISKIKHYPILDYWEPVFARKKGGIILDPDDFYILATREAVAIPFDYAAEMQAYDTSFGEFRVHYAGFFDPGFGMDEAGGKGARGVLEVRTHEVPFLIDAHQIVGHLVFEKMTAASDKIYGSGLKSNYQGQGLHLAKQFIHI
ncbi:MAG: 2'-deoxycytidine 5'-triphosphate deaminase [Pseudomonadota bacterium]